MGMQNKDMDKEHERIGVVSKKNAHQGRSRVTEGNIQESIHRNLDAELVLFTSLPSPDKLVLIG